MDRISVPGYGRTRVPQNYVNRLAPVVGPY